MTNTNEYDLFMAVFNDIEAHLKRRAYGDEASGPSGFATALDNFRAKYPRQITQIQYEEIKTLSHLRNALTHGPAFKDQRLAMPTEVAIDQARKIREALRHPATTLSALKPPPPVSVLCGTGIGDALDAMRLHDFSQLPVCDADGRYLDLLTTNTVARWLSRQFHEHDGLAEQATVAEVLEYRELTELVLLRARGLTTTETLRDFVMAAERGQDLTAIVITHSGKRAEKPLALVVTADMARLTAKG